MLDAIDEDLNAGLITRVQADAAHRKANMAMRMQQRLGWTKRTEGVERAKEIARLDHTKVGPGKSAYAACIIEDIDKLPPGQTMVKIPRDVLAVLVACAGHQVRRPVVRAALARMFETWFL